MTKRISSERLLNERLVTADDALMKREVGIWTLEKLAILSLYFEAFTTACQRAGASYYVDGMAGPGLCIVKDVDAHLTVNGSPLLALQTRPQFTRCILMEYKLSNYNTLRRRVAMYGNRAEVQRGDVNTNLVPMIQQHVPDWAPCFCLLDDPSLP